MPLNAVGILSPGEMGSAVGWALRRHRLDVLTCLDGRSERTRMRALQAGFREVPTHHELVTKCDVLLSILPPAEAVGAAERVANALRSKETKLVYADCNAVAPQTVRRIGRIITEAGGVFVDAGIVGGPPGQGYSPQFYASGPEISAFEELSQFGVDVRPISGEVGKASALKMCYAALTKGSTALWTEILVAAHALGVSDGLRQQFEASQGATYQRMHRALLGMLPKAQRWIGEMEEIATTFEDVGLTPRLFQGAADLYRSLSATPLAKDEPEAEEDSISLPELVELMTFYMTGLPARR